MLVKISVITSWWNDFSIMFLQAFANFKNNWLRARSRQEKKARQLNIRYQIDIVLLFDHHWEVRVLNASRKWSVCKFYWCDRASQFTNLFPTLTLPNFVLLCSVVWSFPPLSTKIWNHAGGNKKKLQSTTSRIQHRTQIALSKAKSLRLFFIILLEHVLVFTRRGSWTIKFKSRK